MGTSSTIAAVEESEIESLIAYVGALTPEQRRQRIAATVVWCLVIAARATYEKSPDGSPAARVLNDLLNAHAEGDGVLDR